MVPQVVLAAVLATGVGPCRTPGLLGRAFGGLFGYPVASASCGGGACSTYGYSGYGGCSTGACGGYGYGGYPAGAYGYGGCSTGACGGYGYPAAGYPTGGCPTGGCPTGGCTTYYWSPTSSSCGTCAAPSYPAPVAPVAPPIVPKTYKDSSEDKPVLPKMDDATKMPVSKDLKFAAKGYGEATSDTKWVVAKLHEGKKHCSVYVLVVRGWVPDVSAVRDKDGVVTKLHFDYSKRKSYKGGQLAFAFEDDAAKAGTSALAAK